ncbi:LysR substrate-binding domain-containing protein [Roseomonas chloroacetimidivorans]|uniref:LysR family transcriptional regulator n=1 Tax=Roseomonas chloroacetimidivorans TaxID=1766656 RepID=UPI003C77402B
MIRLPDLEAWAIFAKVVETGSFSTAATELGLSKATVSKAIARLEERIGAKLLHRTSRRLTLTETGRASSESAARLLEEAMEVEARAISQSAEPEGTVRIAAPMSFGIAHLSPLLPQLLDRHPRISIDLHLSDALVDLVGDGFDLALRIAALPDSTLRTRRICDVRRLLVGAPAYFERHGRPAHPLDLKSHACLGYAYLPTRDRWRFTSRAGEVVDVTPQGPLRINNADAMMPALLAGKGIAVQPEFLVWRALSEGRLEAAMPDWSMPELALNLVTPPGTLRPLRVVAVMEFLAECLEAPPWEGWPNRH